MHQSYLGREMFSEGELQSLLGQVHVMHMPEGGVFIEEGACVGRVGMLLNGKLLVRQGHRAIAKLEAGELVGEAGILGAGEASATVQAETDCTLACLEREALEQLLESQPKLGLKLMQMMASVLVERVRKLG
jgi:CRP-like cAMP-binding protein